MDKLVVCSSLILRQTQWDPPTADGAPPAAPNEYEMDLGTPTYDEKTKRKTTTAAADTSTELAKRTKESFRSKVRHGRVRFSPMACFTLNGYTQDFYCLDGYNFRMAPPSQFCSVL